MSSRLRSIGASMPRGLSRSVVQAPAAAIATGASMRPSLVSTPATLPPCVAIPSTRSPECSTAPAACAAPSQLSTMRVTSI